MKLFCQNCGCHFPNDYEKTLTPPCNFWGEHGLSSLPDDSKKTFWDWLCKIPADEIFIKTGFNIGINFRGYPSDHEAEFETLVPNWNEMTEQERQDFEREYFKRKFKGQKIELPGEKLKEKKIN